MSYDALVLHLILGVYAYVTLLAGVFGKLLWALYRLVNNHHDHLLKALDARLVETERRLTTGEGRTTALEDRHDST